MRAHDLYCIFKENYNEWRKDRVSYRKALN